MLQKMRKIVLLWGPLFVGAPVRPNMLNMPKSVSAHFRNYGAVYEVRGRYNEGENIVTT